MVKALVTRRLPYVGETVLSRSLKLQRVVVSIDDKTISLKAKQTGVFTSLFESLSYDYNSKMSFEDFELGYILIEEQPVEPMQFTPEEMARIAFKFGDVYQHTDTQERVIIGTCSGTEQTSSQTIELLSFDRMVDGEYLVYNVEVKYFKDNFVNAFPPRLRERDVSLSF